jgi:site-specific DNA recombinase
MQDTNTNQTIQPRQGTRPRAELARERRDHHAQTAREIDDLAAEFHARLPREQCRDVGAVYARYSSKYQDSILDQVRPIFEAAITQRIFIPREFVFFDEAVRGFKDRRPGLDQLRLILARKVVSVLLVFATNRLYRKTYKFLQFVEEEVVERGIRCLFVKSGVDTADEKRWRMLMQVHNITDEAVVGMYAEHIRSAHEGLFNNGLVHGTIPYGYRGRDVPGQETKRHRPRQAYEINPETACWVKQAFTWFVEDRLSINEIVRRFNENLNVPQNPRSATGQWTYTLVRYMLANSRYRGWWEYGATEGVWQSKQDYSRQRRRAEPLKAAQCEKLRIVGDALWHLAQKRLIDSKGSAAGRKPKDGDRRSRPRLLNGLFACSEHAQMLYVGGPYGRLMFCKACRAMQKSKRPLYSLLNRLLALRLTCQTLADLMQRDETLVPAVITACNNQAAALQQPDPAQLQRLKVQYDKLTGRIQFIMDNPGDSEADRRESEATIKRLRQQRSAVAAEVSVLEEAQHRVVIVPSQAAVRDLIAQFGEILTAAAHGESEADTSRAREIIDLLTGGKIEMIQQGERKAQCGWLQGRFRLRLLAGVAETFTGVKVVENMEEPLITIDYREPTPTEAYADRVKELFDNGKLIKAIAAELGITRNMATKALDHWFESRGLAKPDGRSRRATLDQKHLEPPRYILIADEAMRLYNEGKLLQEIAVKLESDRNTVSKAIAQWYTSRGLVMPDGRTRRKKLDQPDSRPHAGTDG